MLFKGNSSRLELLIGKIHAHKEPSQDEQHKSKGLNVTSLSFSLLLLSVLLIFIYLKFCCHTKFNFTVALLHSTTFHSSPLNFSRFT